MAAKKAKAAKAAKAKAPKAKPAKRAAKPAKPYVPKAPKAPTKAEQKAAGGRGCPAFDPFGQPCQNTPRMGATYCGIHSHLEKA